MITLFEQFVAEIEKEVEVIVDIVTSDHADLRRDRPENHGTHIDDDWIVKVINKAADQVVKYILFNDLSESECIGIHDKNTDLNLVCSIKNRNYKLEFKVVTAMIKRDFHFRPDTKKVFYV